MPLRTFTSNLAWCGCIRLPQQPQRAIILLAITTSFSSSYIPHICEESYEQFCAVLGAFVCVGTHYSQHACDLCGRSVILHESQLSHTPTKLYGVKRDRIKGSDTSNRDDVVIRSKP